MVQRLLILFTSLAMGLAASLPARAQTPAASKALSAPSVPPPTIADLVLLLQSYKPDLAKTEKLREQVVLASRGSWGVDVCMGVPVLGAKYFII